MRLDVPGNVVEVLVGSARRSVGAESQRAVSTPFLPADMLARAVEQTPVVTCQLAQGDWAVGQSLAAVSLRAETGATVLAIKSGGTMSAAPRAGQLLGAGDVLYLIGDESDLQLARARLARGGA